MWGAVERQQSGVACAAQLTGSSTQRAAELTLLAGIAHAAAAAALITRLCALPCTALPCPALLCPACRDQGQAGCNAAPVGVR